MAERDAELTITADAGQVPDEIKRNVEAPLDHAATVADIMGGKASQALGGVGDAAKKVEGLKFGEAFAAQSTQAGMSVAQIATTVGAVVASLGALRAAKAEVVDTVERIGTVAGLSKDQVSGLSEFIRSIPTDPIEAYQIWVGKATKALEDYVNADRKAALAEALHIPTIDAERMSVGELEKAYAKLTGRIRERQAEIEKLVGASAADVARATENVVQAIRRIEASGRMTEEAAARVKGMIQAAIDSALEANQSISPELQAIADKYGVVSSRSQEAAEQAEKTAQRTAAAAAKEGEAAQAAAATQEDRARREIAASEARAAAAEEESKRKLAAIEQEIKAGEDRVKAAQDAYDAEVERNRATTSDEKELETLKAKWVLTEEESARLEELTKAHLSAAAAADKYKQNTEAARREDEAYGKVLEERNKLEESKSRWLTESLAQSDRARQATYNQAEAEAARLQGIRDLYSAEKEMVDAQVARGEITREEADAHLAASAAAHEQAYNTDQLNKSLAESAKTAPEASKALGDLGESAKAGGDGMASAANDAERMAKALQRIVELLPQVAKLSREVPPLGGAQEGAAA